MGFERETLGTDHEGMLPRVVNDLFEKAEQKTACAFSFRVSFLEIYNEEIRDLLEPSYLSKVRTGRLPRARSEGFALTWCARRVAFRRRHSPNYPHPPHHHHALLHLTS